ATQRPSVDVITGLIKANIPCRIAFQVSARVDSRTILDQMGAETLLGHGDMLYLPPGTSLPTRVHGAFVSDQEVHRVVDALKTPVPPNSIEEVLAGPKAPIPGLTGEEGDGGGGNGEDAEADPLYDEAVRIVTTERKPSISYVQRRLKIGYNRAARLLEAMELAGLVGPLQPNGARDGLAPAPPEGGSSECIRDRKRAFPRPPQVRTVTRPPVRDTVCRVGGALAGAIRLRADSARRLPRQPAHAAHHIPADARRSARPRDRSRDGHAHR